VRGIRLVGWSLIVFSLIVLAPFIALVALGAPRIETAHWFARTESTDWVMLLSTLLWNTSGWDNAGCCAAEVIEPRRNYPKAMAVTVVLVTAVYLFPLAVGVGVASDWAAWKEGYFPQVAAQIGGSWLGFWLTGAALVSAAGMLSALLCTSARVPYAMADRSMLPQPLRRLHRRHGTPWPAIVVNSIGVALLIPFSFQELIELDMFLYAAALILEFAALVWLRISQPGMDRPYRVPFGLAGVIAISVPPVALCLISIALSNPATRYVSFAVIALGIFVYRWQSKLSATAEIEPAPTA
jgi:amino acid transporter